MPQYSVDSRTIENVIGYIKDGQISIPEIQRPFVWDGSKIRDLIDSLFHGYPVGYLIVWQNPNMKDKSGHTTAGKKIMIDGQQRVTAIMTAIVGLKVLDQDFNERVYKIAFNPYASETENSFEVQSAAILKDKKWIPDISILFKSDFDQFSFIDEYCHANPEMSRSELNKLIIRVTNIRNSPIGIINLDKGLSIEEVTEIFIRINSQGKSLTQADFVMSTIAADELHGGNMLRKSIEYFCHLGKNSEFINQIEKDKDFVASQYYPIIKWYADSNESIYTPTFDDLIRAAFMSKYFRGKMANLTDLLHGRNFETRTYEEEILADTFVQFSDGVKTFMDKYTMTQFIETIKSAGFVYRRLIYGRMAIDFAYTLFIRLRNDKTIDKLKVNHYVQRWYVMSVLTSRYGAAPESQLERDLRSIKDKGFLRFYDETMANYGDDFWNVTLPQTLQTSSSTAPVFCVFLAAQCKQSEDSFLGNGSKVRDLIGTADIHHLFPKKFLQKNGIKTAIRYNQVANYAVLSKPVNIAIGSKPPYEYMKEIYDACLEGQESKYTTIKTLEDLNANCRMNCIPSVFKEMAANDYDHFLEKRRFLMAQKIKEYFYSL